MEVHVGNKAEKLVWGSPLLGDQLQRALEQGSKAMDVGKNLTKEDLWIPNVCMWVEFWM